MLHNAAVIAIASFAALILAYFTYGRFIARRIFRLRADRLTPAHTLEDGIDFVPTRVPILFGHHFASIAGAAPITPPLTLKTTRVRAGRFVGAEGLVGCSSLPRPHPKRDVARAGNAVFKLNRYSVGDEVRE